MENENIVLGKTEPAGQEQLPPTADFWINNCSEENDCFFVVGSQDGQTERIGAIRILLMANSVPLQVMLGRGELAEKGDISLPDCEPDAFKHFVKCLYGGSDVIIPKLDLDECSQLLNLFEKYMVFSLKPKLVDVMAKLINENNVFIALLNPVCLLQQKIDCVVSGIVCTSTNKVFSNERFLDLSPETLLFIVKTSNLCATEIEVWEAVLKWGNHVNQTTDGKIVRECIKEHLKFIEFHKMSKEDFVEKVVSTGILEPEEIVDVLKKLVIHREMTCSLRDYEVLQGTFVHVFSNISSFMPRKIETSHPYVFKNWLWKISLEMEENHDKKNKPMFSLYLEWDEKLKWRSGCPWKVYYRKEREAYLARPLVSAEIVVVNQQSKENMKKTLGGIKRGYVSDWDSDMYSWRENDEDETIYWDNVMDPKKGFVQNDTLTVVVTVRTLQSERKREDEDED